MCTVVVVDDDDLNYIQFSLTFEKKIYMFLFPNIIFQQNYFVCVIITMFSIVT